MRWHLWSLTNQFLNSPNNNTNKRNTMGYNWHSDDFTAKLREHERYMDALMDHHNGEEPEYDPDDIDPDHPALLRMKGIREL